jgi:hypothetical protein
MRAFASTMLMIGAVLSAFATPFGGQWVFADPVEPGTVEAGLDTSALCNSEDIVVYAPQAPSTSERLCPAQTREAGETARARAYLIATATPGYTMTRQGPERAIDRLHPEFVNRLAAAIAEVRGAGLPLAGIFSAYRPPAFGVGGFADKFHSLHTYGLAVDVTGIGGPGTPSSLLWHEIAARHGVICPYGPHNLLEWNPLPADMGESHSRRGPPARNRHCGWADQSPGHVRSRLFSDRGVEQRQRPDRGPAPAFFQAAAGADCDGAADHCRGEHQNRLRTAPADLPLHFRPPR